MIDWINNILGISNEVSVPTLISIIVFIIGGIINFAFLKIRELNSRRLYRNTFCFLLTEVIKDLKIKETNMAKFYPQITLTREESFIFTQKTVSYLDTIFELDFKEIYNSYRKRFFFAKRRNLKEKAFHKIWKVLRDLKFNEERLHNSLDDLAKTHSSLLGEYNSHIERYREYNEQQTHQVRSAKKFDIEKELVDFLEEEKNIWFNWEDLGEIRTHYYYSYQKLILPLLNLNRKYSKLPITLEYGRLLVLCELDYNEIKSNIDSYYLIFKNYYLSYRKEHNILQRCLDII